MRTRLLLAIFGAGASHDSVDLHLAPNMETLVSSKLAYRPPLASQLFDERPAFLSAMNRRPEMSMLIPRLRWAAVKGGKTVEEALRDIQEETDRYPLRKSHLLALEFYLSDILGGPVDEWLDRNGRATNYAGLLDQVKYSLGDSPFLFVSFNYDRMLEFAFADVLMHYIRDDLDSYLGDNFALIKPHGSVDWIQELSVSSRSLTHMQGTYEQMAIEIASRPDLVASDIMFRGNPTHPWHPAIAIPLDRGKTFVCPQRHLDRLSSDLGEVTHVLVVGWRAAEQHFLAMLRERLPRNRELSLCIVDQGDGAARAEINLHNALNEVVRFDPIQVHDRGFSDFVRERRVQEWLSGVA